MHMFICVWAYEFYFVHNYLLFSDFLTVAMWYRVVRCKVMLNYEHMRSYVWECCPDLLKLVPVIFLEWWRRIELYIKDGCLLWTSSDGDGSVLGQHGKGPGNVVFTWNDWGMSNDMYVIRWWHVMNLWGFEWERSCPDKVVQCSSNFRQSRTISLAVGAHANTFMKFPTPKSGCMWIGETYPWLKLP
jgi:hypothetical protein